MHKLKFGETIEFGVGMQLTYLNGNLWQITYEGGKYFLTLPSIPEILQSSINEQEK